MHYASPEHFEGEVLDARADLWSVGVILYWLLAGRRPWEADKQDRRPEPVQLSEYVKISAPTPLPEGVSPELVLW